MSDKDPVLEDIDPSDIRVRITFGKYKGSFPEDVPANYLLFIYDQEWLPKVAPDLCDWIESNHEELEERASEEDMYSDCDATDVDLY